jgi:hypothetical protein
MALGARVITVKTVYPNAARLTVRWSHAIPAVTEYDIG